MISKAKVVQVAKLARLGLGTGEIAKMRKELSAILDYIKLLEEIDIAKTKPTFHSIPVKNVMRKDEIKEEVLEVINKILERAPARQKRHIKVKGILK